MCAKRPSAGNGRSPEIKLLCGDRGGESGPSSHLSRGTLCALRAHIGFAFQPLLVPVRLAVRMWDAHPALRPHINLSLIHAPSAMPIAAYEPRSRTNTHARPKGNRSSSHSNRRQLHCDCRRWRNCTLSGSRRLVLVPTAAELNANGCNNRSLCWGVSLRVHEGCVPCDLPTLLHARCDRSGNSSSLW